MNGLFEIFKIEKQEAKQISAAPDPPHFHNYEELIIGIHGKLEHFIDFKTIELKAPLVSFVTQGKTHRAIPKIYDNKCEMWVIRFKSEFIPETIFQLYSNYHENSTLKLEPGSRVDRFDALCQIIDQEMHCKNPDMGVVRHLLSALFSMVESEKSKTTVDFDQMNSKSTTLQCFLKILEDNYRRPLGVEYYAEKLFMSSRNLNLICKNILQQTVTETIETRKLIEAKNQLLHSDKNISEIGYEIGYNDKTHFTKVFKKRTGQTPSEFRAQLSALIS